MPIPGWIAVASGVAAMSAFYTLFMGPLDDRLPSQLRSAETDDSLRAVKSQFRRSWALRTSAMIIVGMIPILAGAALARLGEPNVAASSAPGFDAFHEYVLFIALVGIVGLASGFMWAGTQVRLARLTVPAIDAEQPEAGRVDRMRRRVVGLFLATVALLGILMGFLAAMGVIDAVAASGLFVGMGLGTAVLVAILLVSVRVKTPQ
jgi:MFS family permease